MSQVAKVQAYTNGEIAYISWTLKGMIPGCLGFEITRIYPGNKNENTVLPAWVAFNGQNNKDWLPQDTSVWPVQKLSWKDLTLRKMRDSLKRHPDDTKVQYLVRPVVAYKAGLQEVKPTLKVTYTGKPVRLSYYDEGEKSPVINIQLDYGDIRATFTNGILSTQWLAHLMHSNFKTMKSKIRDPKDKVRQYLAGDSLESLTMLLEKAKNNPKASLKMALYELDDEELMAAIMANANKPGKVDIVLSNTSLDSSKTFWDGENYDNRATLHKSKAKILDRMYDNSSSIGHNKFVIYLEDKKPKMVLTGSTNWTANGMCAQSNNQVIINSAEVAALYDDYFERMKKDTTANFAMPKKVSGKKGYEGTKNKQGKDFRGVNAKGNKAVTLKDGTKITIWFSPNTPNVSVNKTQTPPDLSQVYSLMRKAEKAIFFAVFLPGSGNGWKNSDIETNIITEAIYLGEMDKSLMVYGAISDPMAMPASAKSAPKPKGQKAPAVPFTFDEGKMHIVRAAGLGQPNKHAKRKPDLVGDFEKDLLSLGHAIIHDKIVVIDPLSPKGMVVFGSHNCGFKASYGNDENLVIIQNNPALVQAFALHVLDVFEHYRFRAIQAQRELTGEKNAYSGFLSLDDMWLTKAMGSGGKGDLATYMTTGK